MNKNLSLKYIRAYKDLLDSERVLLVTHVNPDGDALGSVCAFIDLCESLGKDYFAFCKDVPPGSLSFLPHVHKIKNNDFDISDFDLIIILDCGSVERTGIKEKIKTVTKNQKIIEIDHHPKVKDYADLEIRETTAVSTTENIYDFFKTNRILINKNVATNILSGIMTDTFNFLHQHTTERSLSISSEIMNLGGHFPLITKNTFYNKSIESMKLWGLVLSNLKINRKYNIAFSIVPAEYLKNVNKDDCIFDAISGFLGNLEKVKGIMLLREEINKETGETFLKGSLRSSHPMADISKLARVLGGGGHPKSSGFVVNGKLEKYKEGWRAI